MSHDQKPARVRVVDGGTPQRRRADVGANAGQLDRAAHIATPATPRRAKPLLTILFLIGCAAGGAALPLLGAL